MDRTDDDVTSLILANVGYGGYLWEVNDRRLIQEEEVISLVRGVKNLINHLISNVSCDLIFKWLAGLRNSMLRAFLTSK